MCIICSCFKHHWDIQNFTEYQQHMNNKYNQKEDYSNNFTNKNKIENGLQTGIVTN